MTTNSLQLRGIELRYALTWQLALYGAATIPELIDALAYHNFDAGERASKSISDALRWERGYGRVQHPARGRYGLGWMPRGTEHRIHQRVLALREQAKSLRGGQNVKSSGTAGVGSG
nr:hypothetical protein [Mycobacterium genavense]